MSSSIIEKLRGILELLEEASQKHINLVPSENVLSAAAANILPRQLAQRYVFPTAGDTLLYWPSMGEIGELLSLVEGLACTVLGANYCTVRPLSGVQCMTIVLSLLKRRGSRLVYLVPWEFGGHRNAQKLAERLGLEVRFLPFDWESFDIDGNALQSVLPAERSQIAFYLDQWVVLKVPDVRKLREIVGTVPYIHHDTSHLMGLIGGRAMPCPLALGANSCGGSTHKTLPGPQKAILAWNDAALSEAIDEEVGAFVSHPHTGAIGALGIALAEFQQYGERYAQQVLANAQVLGNELARAGMKVVGAEVGYTGTHQVVADLAGSRSMAEQGAALRDHCISLNFLERGILRCEQPVRFGVQELTARGWNEGDVKQLARALMAILIGEAPMAASDVIAALIAEDRASRAWVRSSAYS